MIQRAANTSRAVAEDVGVNHGRRHLAVAEELLDGPDVVTALQEVMAKEWRKVWQLARLSMPVVRTARVTAVVMPLLGRLALPPRRCGKDPLPASVAPRRRKLSVGRVRQTDTAESRGQCRVTFISVGCFEAAADRLLRRRSSTMSQRRLVTPTRIAGRFAQAGIPRRAGDAHAQRARTLLQQPG
jgi:hypothetical protein